ncbi:hypothetical protein ACFOD4_03115 [Pseudoroseomonas globiformis]|uniref:Uncharacterized protein n=1 Tax=Teichococcus globiformis TaxID=2307229 RepID=A0ABV7FXM0_9PROT
MINNDNEILRVLLREVVRRRHQGRGAAGMNGWRGELFRVLQAMARRNG